jgi:cellulose biosynthesis protein BcsQ
MIIALAGQKGGTGKSTLACNIAGLLSKKHKTALIDIDNQCSSTNWFNRRCSNVKNNKVKLFQSLDKLATIKKQFDHIIIDLAGKDSQELRQIVKISDVLLLPVNASMADINTLQYMTTITKSHKSAYVIVNSLLHKNDCKYIDYINKYYPHYICNPDYALKRSVTYIRSANTGNSVDELKTHNSKQITKQLNKIIEGIL